MSAMETRIAPYINSDASTGRISYPATIAPRDGYDVLKNEYRIANLQLVHLMTEDSTPAIRAEMHAIRKDMYGLAVRMNLVRRNPQFGECANE